MSDFKLFLLTENEELDITDNVEYGVLAIDGLGMPGVSLITESGPLQHGVTQVNFKLPPRVITLTIDILATSLEEQFELRNRLISYLNYSNEAIQLKVEYPSGEVRYVDCYLMGGLKMPSRGGVGVTQKDVIQLFCPDPSLYDPDRQIVGFGQGVSTGWQIPMAVPVNVGTDILSVSRDIGYEGDYIEFPIFEIRGPVEDLIIRNLTTDEKLDFQGTVIDAGETYIVDTRYGYKTVTASGVNVIQNLTNDSDLSTFHLDRKLVGEDYHPNIITASGQGATNQTNVYIRYFNRFIGV